jgi:plastocyanin
MSSVEVSMRKIPVRLNVVGTMVVILLGTASCGPPAPPSRGSGPLAAPVHSITVTMLPAQDLFTPFILVIQPHTTVTWDNQDTTAHRIVTTPDHQSFLNPQSFSLQAPAGSHAMFTFSQPGVYHYYEPVLDNWNTHFSRVAAKKDKASPLLAMDGVIWVQGALKTLPLATLNQIPVAHDQFALEFIAIRAPGTISWHNFDEDPHFVGLAPHWSAPINPEDIGIYRMAGTVDVPGGQTVTVSFNTPGLYYYYCRNHDRIDGTTHRAEALMKATEYPLPMEGFVLVAG